MMRKSFLTALLVVGLAGLAAYGAPSKPMPRRDVVEVPAIGKGLCLSNAFQTNMVLQRNKPVNIWGWADPGATVTVEFAGQRVSTRAANDRSWQVTLKPMPANATPQNLTVKSGRQSLTLENILVGDVWLLGGQSNMEFPISKVDDGQLEVISANFPQIRLLTMPVGKGFESVRSFERLYEWSSWSSRHFRKGDWEVCTPQTVREFSAIGYVFGRRLHMASQVPIGLIDASIGGTTVETWTDLAVLRTIQGKETRDMLADWDRRIAEYDPKADLEQRIANYNQRVEDLKKKGQPIPANLKRPTDLRPGPKADKNRPGYCFAGVIAPLRGLAIAGAVFHQGFNNAFNGSAGARMYYQVFAKMISSWRRNFQDEHLPFCIISLCTAGQPQTLDNFLPPMYDAGVLLREAQYKTFCDLRRAGDKTIGFVSSYDQRKSWYHPQIKIPVGERAAKWALASYYQLLTGRDAQQYWLPPAIEKVQRIDGTIRLTLSTTVRTRDDSDDRLLGFAIAGQDRRFYPAHVEWYTDGSKDNRNRPIYRRDTLVLSSPFVPKPLHFRYAWARNPMGNIVNPYGVPLATQRSDDWLLEQTPITIPTPKDMPASSARRYIASRLRKVLELDDMHRRIQEAQALLEQLKPLYEKQRSEWDKKLAEEARNIQAGK